MLTSQCFSGYYNEAFQNNNFAYSAAISCFLLALVLVLILPLTYWTNRRK